MQKLPGLFIAPSSFGDRGVFTASEIPKGSPIEVCPVIVMDGTDRIYLDQTHLHDYYFIWGEDDQKCAIVLGFGSLYNHAYEPNAEYVPDFSGNCLNFYALRTIEAGEEITVNYSGTPSGRKALWFKVED